jgi:hypothetical protein
LDGVPYNSVLCVSIGPGGTGKTATRLAMQGKPLTAQRESTQGGDLQQLVIRLGQMLDFVEVDGRLSQLDRAVLVQLRAEARAAVQLASVEQLVGLVGKTADAHANVDELSRQLREKELALTAVVVTEAAAESQQESEREWGSGHARAVRPSVSTGSVEAKSATTNLKPTPAPRPPPKPPKPSPPAEQIHFSRDEEGFLADRVQQLEAQGVQEGVHVTFFDMGGQPEFASIAAEFLRR